MRARQPTAPVVHDDDPDDKASGSEAESDCSSEAPQKRQPKGLEATRKVAQAGEGKQPAKAPRTYPVFAKLMREHLKKAQPGEGCAPSLPRAPVLMLALPVWLPASRQLATS